MSIRSTIISAIAAGLRNITLAKGFETNIAKVSRGIRSVDDFLGDIPAITIWNEKMTREDTAQVISKSTLRLHLWGFVKVDARNDDYINLDKLASDIEKCLNNPTYNPYMSKGFTFIRETYFYEGGTQDSFGMLDMIVDIDFFYPIASP